MYLREFSFPDMDEEFTFPLSHTVFPPDTATMRYADCFIPHSQFHIRRGF